MCAPAHYLTLEPIESSDRSGCLSANNQLRDRSRDLTLRKFFIELVRGWESLSLVLLLVSPRRQGASIAVCHWLSRTLFVRATSSEAGRDTKR